MSDEDIRTKHPSYGLVSFSRVTGNPGRLFGSPLTNHQSFVRLSIGPGERIHNLGADRFYGSVRGEMIEVLLSAAQFAELVTTMNIGLGVPCTISRLNGQKVEAPPEEPTESEHVQLGFEKDAQRLRDDMYKFADEIGELMSTKKNISQQDRQRIMKALNKFVSRVVDDMPFMLGQFAEATEKVTQHAKTEIDAFVTSCALAEGIESLLEKSKSRAPALEAQGQAVPQLPEKK